MNPSIKQSLTQIFVTTDDEEFLLNKFLDVGATILGQCRDEAPAPRPGLTAGE